MVIKIVNHSRTVLRIAKSLGWRVGARYTNLRDVKGLGPVDFIDIDWKNYDFDRHVHALKSATPLLTIARDIEDIDCFDDIMVEAEELSKYAGHVAIVPKDIRLSEIMEDQTPRSYIFGYSTPTGYGGTKIATEHFKRPVHLLGGRPDTQRKLADEMNVFSFDCNRFTYDARFGDFFDGEIFRPHPVGGYGRCLEDSIRNINTLWDNYTAISELRV